MPIDPSIALQNKPTVDVNQGYNPLDAHFKALTLASLMDQRKFNQSEADRKMWLERYKLSDMQSREAKRKIAALKSLNPDGTINADKFYAELLQIDEGKQADEFYKSYGLGLKDRRAAQKEDVANQQQLASLGYSLVQGVDELGRQYGYDHPAVLEASKNAVLRYNDQARSIGAKELPVNAPQALDPAHLAAAMEGFKTAHQRLEESKAMPEAGRAGAAYDRLVSRNAEVTTEVAPKNQIDVDKISDAQPEAGAPDATVQTFHPEEIRPVEEGGNVPGSPSKIVQGPMPEHNTSFTETSTPKNSMTLKALARIAQGDADSSMKYDSNGVAVRDKAAFDTALALKKAGATKIDNKVLVGDRKLAEGIAGPLGKTIENNFLSAKKSANTIETIRDLSSALDEGKVLLGPGASPRMWTLRLASAMGVKGSDYKETLVNTRKAIQLLAQQELDSAIQMQGQGQITEAERDIIRRAASGNIDENSLPELQSLVRSMDKVARSNIRSNRKNVELQKQNRETFGSLPDFMGVEEPPPVFDEGGGRIGAKQGPPGSANQPIRRYNRETGKIE